MIYHTIMHFHSQYYENEVYMQLKRDTCLLQYRVE